MSFSIESNFFPKDVKARDFSLRNIVKAKSSIFYSEFHYCSICFVSNLAYENYRYVIQVHTHTYCWILREIDWPNFCIALSVMKADDHSSILFITKIYIKIHHSIVILYLVYVSISNTNSPLSKWKLEAACQNPMAVGGLKICRYYWIQFLALLVNLCKYLTYRYVVQFFSKGTIWQKKHSEQSIKLLL